MSATTNQAFDNAFKRFLESLPESERLRYSPCASSKDLLDGMRKLRGLTKAQWEGKGRSVIACINRLNTQMKPFFEAVNIVVSSHPEYAAIFWGSIRLILQICENFSGFFEKVLSILDAFSDVLPLYDSIEFLRTGPASERIIRHLEGIYLNMFTFFQLAVEVFTKPDGSTRRRAAVTWDLIWTPADARFKDVLESFRRYRSLLNEEVLILQAKSQNDAKAAAEHEARLAAEERQWARKDREKMTELCQRTHQIKTVMTEELKVQKVEEIRKWLNPPTGFEDTFDSSLEAREDGTCSWIHDIQAFQKWRDMTATASTTESKKEFGQNVFWIHGNPGTGKTVLAASVIQDLQEPTTPTHDITVCYFFFRAEATNTSSTRPAAAWSAILAQLLQKNHRDQAIIDKFAFSMLHGSGQRKASRKNLVGVLQLCSKVLGKLYIVLDGVDECLDREDLLNMVSKISAVPSVKTLLFSRPNVLGLLRMTTDAQRLQINRSDVKDDITTYISNQVLGLIEDEYLPEVDSENLVGQLVSGADGMFLWAKLMIKLLRCPVLTPMRRLSMISEVIHPEGLEAMYGRILSLVSESTMLEKDAAKKVFYWLTFAKAPVTLGLLYEIIHMVRPADVINATKVARDFHSVIRVVCGALVEFEDTTSQSKEQSPPSLPRHFGLRVRFIHLSVREYFSQITYDSDPTTHTLVMEPPLAHAVMACETLGLLLTVEPTSASYYSELFEYCALYWMTHFRDSAEGRKPEELLQSPDIHSTIRNLVSLLTDFLNHPFLVTRWVQTYYKSNSISTKVPYRDLRVWVEWIHYSGLSFAQFGAVPHLSHQATEFLHDMAWLSEEWGVKLKANPGLIWNEANAFLKSSFIVRGSITNVTRLASSVSENSNRSSRPLAEISAASTDGKMNFRLSIWPTKVFEEIWSTLQSYHHVPVVKDTCRGWSLQYELWGVDSKSSAGQITIPLDESEVWLAMRQLLRQTDAGDWRTAFPMAIASSGYLVTVLRAVYSFSHANGSITWNSVLLPIDFTGAHADQWNSDLTAYNPEEKLNLQRRENPALYRYSIIFSPTERYLLFTDNPDLEDHHAVFAITTRPTLRVNIVGRVSHPSSNFLVTASVASLQQARFHTSLDLVALCQRGTIFLWPFQQVESSLIMVKRMLSRMFPQDIRFSSCGKFIVLSFDYNEPADVIQIPDELLDLGRTSEDGTPRSNLPLSPPPATHVSYRTSGAVSSFGIRPGQAITSNTCVVRSDESNRTQLLEVHRGDRPSIRVSSLADGEPPQSFELLTLPITTHVNHTVPTAIMPKSAHDPVRILINSASHDDYSMNEQERQYYPALVERKLNSEVFRQENHHSTSLRGSRSRPLKIKEEPPVQGFQRTGYASSPLSAKPTPTVGPDVQHQSHLPLPAVFSRYQPPYRSCGSSSSGTAQSLP